MQSRMLCGLASVTLADAGCERDLALCWKLTATLWRCLVLQTTLLYQRLRKSTRQTVKSMSLPPRNGRGNMPCDNKQAWPAELEGGGDSVILVVDPCLPVSHLLFDGNTFTHVPLLPPPSARHRYWATSAQGGVTRRGVVLTYLLSLVIGSQ